MAYISFLNRVFLILGCFRDASRYFFKPQSWRIVRLEFRTAYKFSLPLISAISPKYLKRPALRSRNSRGVPL